MAASICASDALAAPAVALEGYGWTPPGAARPALADVTLRIAPGECVLLCGSTGSGKSTLLRAIAGALPPGGAPRGRLVVTGRAALLFQDVDTQLLFSTVREEVGSGLRQGGTDAAQRVEAALARTGLAGLAARVVEDLSAGERQRVVLAALLAGDPALLLLDEPSSALDPEARARLVDALVRLKRDGHTLLVAEHVTAPFRGLADRCLALHDGRLVEHDGVRAAVGRARPSAVGLGDAGAAFEPRRTPVASPPLVRWHRVGVRDGNGRARLAATDLVVRPGERVLVSGGNGAGKSTLLRVLAGLESATGGRAERSHVLGSAAPGPAAPAAPRGVALVLQSPPRNLFARSVAEELAFTARRSGVPTEALERRVRALLDACGLAAVRDRSPLRLSFGEQHRVAIAAALAARPALLLLDEPFAGLDTGARDALLALLARDQAQTGTAIVLATHDASGLEGWADQHQRLGPLPRQALSAVAPPPMEPESAGAPAGRGFHFRETGSPLHRCGVGWKLLAVLGGSAAAVAARSPLALALLLACWLGGYRGARLSRGELWQDVRWLLAQAGVVVALSALQGGAEGAAVGAQAAGRIAAFFLPGALLLRTTPAGRLLAGVQRLLPPRLAFALATSLRFVPYFARELHEILAVQRLRGARLAGRDAWRPAAWRDAIACVGVPLAVRAIHTANEVAWAAEVRGVVATSPPASAGGVAARSAIPADPASAAGERIR